MNRDEIRHVRFRTDGYGYDASQVDDLLRCIAAELDAGRPVGPLIASATFRPRQTGFWGYDIDTVDWLLEQLAWPGDRSGLAGMSADPWRDLAVGNHYIRGAPGDLAEHAAAPPQRGRLKDWRRDRDFLAQECAEELRDCGQQPGTHLWWGRAKRRRELRTTEQHTLASLRGYGRASIRWNGLSRGYGRPLTIGAGGRSFAFKKKGSGRSSSPDLAEIAARSTRDLNGHFLAADTPHLGADTTRNRKRQAKASSQESRGVFTEPKELVDETGTPILYVSGNNYRHRAYASITFPDRRWLRFLVRGTKPGNAIMTAVDQAGNRVARYRITQSPKRGVEITVHPGWKLTDELVLAIAISAPWLRSYFLVPSDGG